MASLRPFDFARPEIAGWDADAPPDTVIWLTDGFDAERLHVNKLPQRYAVPGTPIRIATDRSDAAMRALGIPLAAVP